MLSCVVFILKQLNQRHLEGHTSSWLVGPEPEAQLERALLQVSERETDGEGRGADDKRLEDDG